MDKSCDVVVIGGGLAGLTAAIHLGKFGVKVYVIEKNRFPKHKVCGEYVSNEVLPYLNSLGVDTKELQQVAISRTSISTVNGKQIFSDLPLGGFGISRYLLDKILHDHAKDIGCNIIHESVCDIDFHSESFTIKTDNGTLVSARIAIGAFGKRSNLDHRLSRKFIAEKAPWLAVKAHYIGDFPENLVSLHNFKGGYCGVSKVEDNKINICYLADYRSFKKHKDINEYQDKVLKQNPLLKALLDKYTMEFEKPLTISQISFSEKPTIENHILMIGDTAGVIHPLCGNGMAIAIHSAKIASEVTIEYLQGTITRKELETKYSATWQAYFGSRMKIGKVLAKILSKEKLSNFLMSALTAFPFVLPEIIKRTHGKPFTIANGD